MTDLKVGDRVTCVRQVNKSIPLGSKGYVSMTKDEDSICISWDNYNSGHAGSSDMSKEGKALGSDRSHYWVPTEWVKGVAKKVEVPLNRQKDIMISILNEHIETVNKWLKYEEGMINLMEYKEYMSKKKASLMERIRKVKSVK